MLFLFLSIHIFSQENSEEKINHIVDQWHKAASQADFDMYFSLMTKEGVFIGTDATENWTNKEFRRFSKPYFDRGKAWNFKSLERNVYFHENRTIAWFDELLDTQMGICRGSGILHQTKNGWKIAHYVLSIAVPNENVERLTEMKKEFDQNFIETLENKSADK